PQVLKANAVGAHFIEPDACEIQYIIEIVFFPYGDEHQQVVKPEHQDHPIENAEEEILVQRVGKQPSLRTQYEEHVGVLFGLYPGVVRDFRIRRELQGYYK